MHKNDNKKGGSSIKEEVVANVVGEAKSGKSPTRATSGKKHK